MGAAGPVFVSYSSHDVEVADRFVRAIEAAEVRCWMAPRDIPPGSSYPSEITSAIQSAGAMLVIVTEAANASPHVLREVEMAFNAGKPILPIHLTSVSLSPNLTYFLSTRQWLDAGDAFDDGDTNRVVHSLRQLLAGGANAVEPSVETSITRQDRGRWTKGAVIGGGAALILLVVVIVAVVSRYEKKPPEPQQAEGTVTTLPRERPAPATAADGVPRVRESGERGTPATSPDTSVPPPTPVSGRSAAAARPTRVNAADGQTYVQIPAGEFTMGCSPDDPACGDDERPRHLVTIARPFWMGRTEVTGAQYHKLHPRDGSAITPDSPVTEVTWAAAKEYCKAVGGRLPREAEWEYAARGGTTTRTYGPLDAIAWSARNSDAHAHPVGQRQPNRFGLYDMLGNVHEWVLDRYFNSYGDEDDAGPVVEPVASNASATVRGGAWTSEAKGMRVSARLSRPPDTADPNVGFRCVMD